jgi:hypothetical protein
MAAGTREASSSHVTDSEATPVPPVGPDELAAHGGIAGPGPEPIWSAIRIIILGPRLRGVDDCGRF